ncbi:MAG: oligosaccharide flippase family protein [Thermomicrobiales bacterium]
MPSCEAEGSTLARSPARGSLRQNVSWTVVGNFGFAACQWLMLVVLAKSGSAAMVGQFALALSLTAPIMLMSNLNLRAVQTTDVDDEYAFATFFRLRAATTMLSLAVCLVIVTVATFSRDTALVIGFVALAKAAESMSDVFYGRLQKNERMDRIAKSMLIRGAASLIAMAVLVSVTSSVVWGACGVFVAWLIVLLLYDLRSTAGEPVTSHLRGSLFREWDSQGLRTLLSLAWLALPLGIVQMFISLNTNIPRFFIQASSGEHALGIYSAIAYVTVAGSTFVAAVGQAVSPRLAHLYASGDRKGFVRLLQILAGFFVACCVLALVLVLNAGEYVLSTLYTPEYAKESPLLIIMTLSFGVGSLVSVLGFGITAARRFRPQVPLVVLAVIIATVASAILVPRFGITGAAWAILASLAVWSIASAGVLWSALSGLGAPSTTLDQKEAAILAAKP